MEEIKVPLDDKRSSRRCVLESRHVTLTTITLLTILLLLPIGWTMYRTYVISVLNSHVTEHVTLLERQVALLQDACAVRDAYVEDKSQGHGRYRRSAGGVEAALPASRQVIQSVHFEADVPPDYVNKRWEEQESVYIREYRGHLSKAGFSPDGRKFRFWTRKTNYTLPDFLHINGGNHITITQSGLYYVYAQILFHDLSGRWAFSVYTDDEPRIQCMTSSVVPPNYMDGMDGHGLFTHCYTAAGIHIERNQRVSIRSMYNERVIVLLDRSTFWGIIKLA